MASFDFRGDTLAHLFVLAAVVNVVQSFTTSVDFTEAINTPSPHNFLVLPIKSSTAKTSAVPSEIDIGTSLSSAFDTLVGASNFMESSSQSSSGHQLSSCRMPVFGDSATVTFAPRPSTWNVENGTPTEYILSASGFDCPIEDFGMLCLEMYRHRADIRHVVCVKDIESNMLDYLNSKPPDPGMDAELTSSTAIGNEKMGSLLNQLVDSESLDKLQQDGYVVIDDVMKTSQLSNHKLCEWADKGRTGQGKSRTDTVAFLNRSNALECGIEDQYDFLLTLASHLNENLDLYASPYTHVFPGTKDRPLTNPSGFNVQMAEYCYSDYYKPHSDNSIDREVRDNGVFEGHHTKFTNSLLPSLTDANDTVLPKQRSNWRCITAILYLNEGWKQSDGGQLRMYLDSAGVEHPKTAADTHNHVDINPSNGKLLLFDSRMIHSVEKVLNAGKTRRALTLWITRPEENGVTGEDFFLTDPEE